MHRYCECSDQACPCCDGDCSNVATTTIYRIDMDDESGTPTCDGCAEDAMKSGLFTTRDEDKDDEPGEDDLTTTDDRHFYLCGRLAFVVGEDEDRDERLLDQRPR